MSKTVYYDGTTYSVTKIGDFAFFNCSGLTSVSIPYSVINIGIGAFIYCTGLTSVNIPNSVNSIGKEAFASCSGLISVNIPNSVTSIGDIAFYDCSSLVSLIIPNSVYSIGSRAFDSCKGLTTINISNSVTSINNSTFSNCSSLTSLNVPNSVTNIGRGAFAYCNGLKILDLPNSVTSISEYAFFDCVGLTSLSIPNSVTSIAEHTFAGCKGLTTLSIPNSVTSIAELAFANCSSLTTLSIPKSVTSIGKMAFYLCNGLQSVTVNWTTPLPIDEIVFYYVPVASATLYVPAGTIAAYKAAPVWKEFGTILEQTALPLTLTSLTAKAIATGNQINWATANVVNVKNINLERSGADKIFTAIASLPVTSTQFIDINPLAGDNYYRLSTTDNDGSPITYPQIAFVKGLTNDVSFYPNPVTNGVLNVVAGSAKIHSVALFNLNGKKVVFVNTKNSPSKIAVSTQSLVKGIYLLEISSEKGKTIKKVLVN